MDSLEFFGSFVWGISESDKDNSSLVRIYDSILSVLTNI